MYIYVINVVFEIFAYYMGRKHFQLKSLGGKKKSILHIRYLFVWNSFWLHTSASTLYPKLNTLNKLNQLNDVFSHKVSRKVLSCSISTALENENFIYLWILYRIVSENSPSFLSFLFLVQEWKFFQEGNRKIKEFIWVFFSPSFGCVLLFGEKTNIFRRNFVFRWIVNLTGKHTQVLSCSLYLCLVLSDVGS